MLASWGTAFLRGSVTLDDTVRMVEDGDEPHLVVSHAFADPAELSEALLGLREDGVTGLRLALPVPGDPLGLVGPPEVNHAALGAGEAVIAVPASTHSTSVPALVPDVRAFGSPGDQGFCVTWRVGQAAVSTPDAPTVSQAERDLVAALQSASQTLVDLDVSSWAGGDVTGRLRRTSRTLVLPEAAGARGRALAQRAVDVLAIVDLAVDDDGGAVTAHAAQARRAALAPIGAAARRALVAGVGAALEGAGRPPALGSVRHR